MKTNSKRLPFFLLPLGMMLSGVAFSNDGGLPLEYQANRTASVSPLAATTGSCSAPRIVYATSDISTSTTSTAFVNVPNMAVNFTIPGTTRTCLKVAYSATVWTGIDQLIYVRAVLDGGIVAEPSNVQFEGDSDEEGDGKWARAHAFNFFFKNVTPGAHTVSIQWRSFFGGTVVTHWRSMAVHTR